MLISLMCEYCDSPLHSFVEELEDGTKLQLEVCPTCYKHYIVVPSTKVEACQRVSTVVSTS